jgi:hypothetical protein
MQRLSWEEYLSVAEKENDVQALMHIYTKCPNYAIQTKAIEILNQAFGVKVAA